jgi:hypothetical protein
VTYTTSRVSRRTRAAAKAGSAPVDVGNCIAPVQSAEDVSKPLPSTGAPATDTHFHRQARTERSLVDRRATLGGTSAETIVGETSAEAFGPDRFRGTVKSVVTVS